jgi:hypothetical protein
VAAGGASEPEGVLLDLEMPSVNRPARGVERPGEADGKRSVKGDADGDPDVQRGACAFPTLDLGDPCSAEAYARGQVSERHALGAPACTNHLPERSSKRGRLALTLDDFARASDSRHHGMGSRYAAGMRRDRTAQRFAHPYRAHRSRSLHQRNCLSAE